MVVAWGTPCTHISQEEAGKKYIKQLWKLQKLFILTNILCTTVGNTLQVFNRGAFPFKKINTADLKTWYCAIHKGRLKDIMIYSLKEAEDTVLD